MASNSTSKRGPRAIAVELSGGEVTVYANARVADALQELTADMTMYHGVRLAQVVQAVYDQGLRNGRREVFDEFDRMKQRPELKHRNPGRPTKTAARKAAVKKAAAKKAAAKKAAVKKAAVKKAAVKKSLPRGR